MFKKSILLACFINAALSFEEATTIFMRDQNALSLDKIKQASHEFAAAPTGVAKEYFRRVGPQCDKNISALARLLNNLEERFPRARCLLLIDLWTQIKQYNDAGIDLICILESLNLEMEGASEEFDLAFKPDKAFVKMLEEFKTDTLDLWNLSKLPQKIRADQLRKLAECRDFIRAEYPDLSEKMDVICELCGAPNQ